jgi:ABC-type nitrate/sulfonate/bicarbonate transport system substrate-binding protein
MMLTRRTTLGLLTCLLPLPAVAESGLVPVTLAVSSSTLAYGGLRIAEQAGLFQKNGLQPKIIVMESGNAAITAVLSGSAEFSGAGPGEVLAARVRGQKMLIVVNCYRGLSGSLVLSKAVAAKLGDAAKGSIEQRVKALDGLTIAEPSATSAYLHPFRSAAESQQATIHFVYMTQPAMVAALQAGVIQGMVAGAPFSQSAIANGSGVLWISGPKAELPASVLPTSSACLQTSEAYAAAHPDTIKRLLAVFADLQALISQHPADAKAALAKGYPQLNSATIDDVFQTEAPNWTRPIMTAADIRQEIAIQKSSGALLGVEKVDPVSVLLPSS